MKLQTLITLLPAGEFVSRTPPSVEPASLAAVKLAKCSPNSLDYCANTAYNATQAHIYVCGDSRLGPVHMPTKLPLDSLLDIYDRFAGLCPGAFLNTWINTTTGWWIYPPSDGFSLDVAGKPILGQISLPVGALIDRFGAETGGYASPAAAPYMQRALPPSNLDTPSNDPT
jgi:hypothetical protein